MAWKEQCKVAFKTTVRARSGPKGGVVKTMRQLSKESGIPYNTLRNWYYKKDKGNQVDRVTENGNKAGRPTKLQKKREISQESRQVLAQIKSIITRLKAATTIVESLPDDALELPEWKEVRNAHKA